MDEPFLHSYLSTTVSVLSLIVSVIAVGVSWKAQRTSNALQKRVVEIEEQREKNKQLEAEQASIYPEFRKTGGGSYRLYLINSGLAEARNIEVKLDGKPLNEHATAVQGDNVPNCIGPNSEASCLLAISMDCAPPFEIEVRWDDDSDVERIYRGTLTF